MFYLGIDGGGTKTEFVIIDNIGNILSHIITTSCHYRQVGFDGFREIVKKGVLEVCNNGKISASSIKKYFIGIPGYGESEEDTEKLNRIIAEIVNTPNFICRNDSEAGLAGSLACKEGINIVAGTGAMGLGKKGNSIVRSGGFGPFCGDEGSAYWLGRKLIEIFAKESDGRLEVSSVYRIVKEKLGISKDFDIIALTMDDYKMNRDKIAGLAVYLHEAALDGDINAVEVFVNAAYELWLLVDATAKGLGYNKDDKIYVSYSGGVFKSGELILNPLSRYILNKYKNAEIVEPILKPVTGAALYAFYETVGCISEEIIARLICEEKDFVFKRNEVIIHGID